MNETSSKSGLVPIAPEAFGRYSLVAKMAIGGMGEIFLAQRAVVEGLTQLVVLKRIRLELAADPQFQQRFMAEARVLLHLQHGAITQVFDVGRVDERTYIALEFVDGKDLRMLLQRAQEKNERVAPPMALQILLRVLDALAYAHRKKGDDDQGLNLVHRDVSPQNVLVSYEGEVKVIDFGLAKSALSVQRTHPSVMLGKLLYMAPEIARHDQLDRRADLFSAAVMLHELLWGRHELATLKPAELMMRVVQPRYRPLEPEIPGLPPGLDAALQRGLAVDPENRFRTAEEMRAAFLPLAVAAGADLSPEPLGEYLRGMFAPEFTSERALLRKLRTGESAPRSDPTLQVLDLRSVQEVAKTMPFPSIGTSGPPNVNPTVLRAPLEEPTPIPVDPTFVGEMPRSSKTEPAQSSLDSAEFLFRPKGRTTTVGEIAAQAPPLGNMQTIRPGELFAAVADPTPSVPWVAAATDPAAPERELITDPLAKVAESSATMPAMRSLQVEVQPKAVEPDAFPTDPPLSSEVGRPRSITAAKPSEGAPPQRSRTGELAVPRARAEKSPPRTRTSDSVPRAERPAHLPARSSPWLIVLGIFLGVVLVGSVAVGLYWATHH